MAKNKGIHEYNLQEVIHYFRGIHLGANASNNPPAISKFVYIRPYSEDNVSCTYDSPFIGKVYITITKNTFFELPLKSKEDWIRFENFIGVLSQAADVGIRMLSESISDKLGLSFS